MPYPASLSQVFQLAKTSHLALIARRNLHYSGWTKKVWYTRCTIYDLLKTISTQVIFPFIRHSQFLRKSTRKLKHQQAIGKRFIQNDCRTSSDQLGIYFQFKKSSFRLVGVVTTYASWGVLPFSADRFGHWLGGPAQGGCFHRDLFQWCLKVQRRYLMFTMPLLSSKLFEG